MVKPWIANDKIENSGEIFSRLGNVTKLKDWCGHCHDRCHKVFPFTELGKNLLSSAEVSLKLKLIQSCIPIKR